MTMNLTLQNKGSFLTRFLLIGDWSVLVDTLDADLGTGKDHGIR